MALAANRSLAEQNLDVKPRLEKERARLVGKYSELEEVREKYKQHCVLRGKKKLILVKKEKEEKECWSKYGLYMGAEIGVKLSFIFI